MPARRRPRAAARRTWRSVYDASETPRAEPRRPPVPAPRRRARVHGRRARARARRARARGPLRDGDRLNADGFVWEMLVQHEHQHNETMLQTLQLAEPGNLRPGARAAPAAAARPRRDRAASQAGPVRDGRRRRRASPTTTSARAHEVDAAGVRDRPHAGDQRRLRRVRATTAATAPRALERRGLGLARAGARASARSTGPATAASAASTASSRSTRPAGDARLAGTRPTPTRAGRRAAADRGRVGEGGATDSHGSRASPAATSTSSTSARRGAAARPRRLGDRRLLGVDRQPTSAATPDSRRSPTPSTREVFFGGRLPGAARRLVGHPAERRPRHLPQLGPTRSGARSSPASAARE